MKAKLKKLLSMKHSRLVIILIIIAIAVPLLLTNTTIKNKIFGSKNTVTMRTATVKKGNIQVVVSGSGPIYFTNEKKLYSKINATITKVNFKEGDKVKAGDVIAEFDDSDAQNTINDSNNNLAQNQLSAKSSYLDAANLTIKAPFAGQISSIQVSTGDTVQKGGTVLTITDSSGTKHNVISTTGGTVQSISVKESQSVGSGTVLAVMQNDAVIIAKESADLKIAGSKNQLNTNMKLLDKYKVTAPINGVITKISFKEGDAVKPGDEVSDVVDPTQMQFDIPVDELDVAKIAAGQKTSITVDALPDTAANPLQGVVSKIPVEGTTNNGVTTFPVTVKINSNLNVLKGGLNANADIEVSNEENVLYVPIEAVSKIGNKRYVMVKGSGTNTSTKSGFQFGGGQNSSNRQSQRNISSTASSGKNQNYYANAVRKEVEVGSNNDSYIEIKTGISEGDIIILPQLQASSTNSTQNQSGLNMGRTPGASGGGGGFNGGGNRGGGN